MGYEATERDIKEILQFRTDISPFLVHLTRTRNGADAKNILMKILEERKLKQSGDEKISDARFGIDDRKIDSNEKKDLFSAICFSETPLNEIHSLLDIKGRQVKLEPYGLVFLKDQLVKKNVSPVFYINNEPNDKNKVLEALLSLRKYYSSEANCIIPLIAVFGQKVTAPNANKNQNGKINFSWEREWRYPHINGDLDFNEKDVFIGLCPNDEISDFETRFSPIAFVDPIRNMKYYAMKLIKARDRLTLKCSVV